MVRHTTTRRRFLQVGCAVVVAVLTASTGVAIAAEDKEAAKVGAPDCNSYESSTGNPIYSYEDCTGPGYEPDVVGADAKSRDIALRLFINSLTFCTKYPDYKALEAAGWKGEKGTQNGSHWRNPDAKGEETISTTEGVIKAALYPDAAVVADPDGRIGQMMWEGKGIAPIGSIPLLHDHTHNQKHEMLHIQCAPTIEGMFGFERYDLIGDQAELQTALQAAKTGGLAAVSTQLKAAGETTAAPVGAGTQTQSAATAKSTKSTGTGGTQAVTGSAVAPRSPAVRSNAGASTTGQRLTPPWAKSSGTSGAATGSTVRSFGAQSTTSGSTSR